MSLQAVARKAVVIRPLIIVELLSLNLMLMNMLSVTWRLVLKVTDSKLLVFSDLLGAFLQGSVVMIGV
ncbi:hypothetical protein A6U87_24415 [Rhizobium sp. AC44/96]|nr:hypothetical protein A6U87_24415 [Rhizobium sp. AC44/96]